MPQTSLGRVSNSSSKSFTNAKGAMANVNYGKIVGSYDNNDISFKIQQQNSVPSVTINLPVTNNQPCYDIYGSGCGRFTN